MEFLILVGVLLFFFTMFFIAIYINTSDMAKKRADIVAKEIALTIQNEINLAYRSSDGYYREFQIPYDIDGKDYIVSIVGNLVYVKTEDGKHAIALSIRNVTGQIAGNKNIIQKINGEVKLNS